MSGMHARPLAPRSATGDGEIESANILIVDDSPMMRELLAAQLRRQGYLNMSFACDGRDALRVIKNETPDLVVLDLMMPEMDGFEVCRKLRADPATADLPVLVQTAMEETDRRLNVFEAGATDMVLKPTNPLELCARVRIHLENRLLFRKLSAFRTRMKSELHQAHEMQKSLLPASVDIDEIGTRYGVRIAAHYEGSMELGGDIWGVRPLDDLRLAVYVTDFSGHGVGAALNTFRFHTFMMRPELDLATPQSCMTAFNGFLRRVLPVGQYATMFYGVIDIEDSSLRYVSAAAPVPVTRLGFGSDFACLDSSGLPLGVVDDPEYEMRQIDFPPGSFLFLYSDALIETPNMSNPVFDPDGLRHFLAKTAADGDPVSATRATLSELTVKAPDGLSDDLTIVSLCRAMEGD